MASLYGVLTASELYDMAAADLREDYLDLSGENYVLSVSQIEAQITYAERMVNTHTKQTWDSEAPDQIKLAVGTIAEWRCKNILHQKGYLEKWVPKFYKDFKELLNDMLFEESREGQFDDITSMEDWSV